MALATGSRHSHAVLAVIKTLQRGGAESLLVSQARMALEAGLSFDVIFDSRYAGPVVGELRSMGCRTHGISNLERAFRSIRTRATDYCIVHTHSPAPAVTARIAVGTLRDRPALVHTEHSSWARYHRATRIANRLTFQLNDHAFAVSENAACSMSRGARNRTEVLHHGTDVQAIEDRALKGQGRLRKDLGISAHVPVVGTIANVKPEKDYPNLLSAAGMVLKERPEIHFVAIGRGPFAGELETLVHARRRPDRFHFLGPREDAIELAADFDILVLASRIEGLPVVLMEALALGLPVVATDAGGVREIIEHGVSGLLVPPREPTELALAILRLVGDPVLAKRLAAGARKRRDAFSLDRLKDSLLATYDRVCRVGLH